MRFKVWFVLVYSISVSGVNVQEEIGTMHGFVICKEFYVLKIALFKCRLARAIGVECPFRR
jgi:hypothetical protein